MSYPLDAVEGEITRLWEYEAGKSSTPRMELMTVVALVSDPVLLKRAQEGVASIVRVHPSRTIVALSRDGDQALITAEVSLHRALPGGPARGDAITLVSVGAGREWLPENIDRLALADLPVCVWWVGDLPDFDQLFDRLASYADMVIVNSCDMDLRDLEVLAEISRRLQGRSALTDLTWTGLRPFQELIARFFDDESARACIASVERIRIEFAPRADTGDATSTQAGLLFGWMVNALSLDPETVRWRRGEGWAEASIGHVVTRFEGRARSDVPPGTILSVSLECPGSRFEVERQGDPQLLRWSRTVPGVATPTQIVRIAIHDEATLLVRSLERPHRDTLLETSLLAGSRVVRPVAPRLLQPPPR